MQRRCSRRGWTPAQIETAKKMYAEGVLLKVIAARVGHPESSISNMVHRPENRVRRRLVAGKAVRVRLPPELHEELWRRARERGCHLTYVVEDLLRKALA